MKKLNITKLTLLCASSLFLMACEDDFSNPVGDTSSYSSGTGDFNNYVSIGDSLTAGFADNALYRSGQIDSFPNILATQFKLVGGGDFIQPLMNEETKDGNGVLTGGTGGLLFGGNINPIFPNRLVLDADPTLSRPTPKTIEGTPNDEVFNSPLVGTTFNNMGVPGARSFHLSLAPTYGNPAGLGVVPATANPYYVRFSKETGATTIMDDAVVKQIPTFFTLWIGNNDVLGYATDGGDASLDAITNTGTFTAAYADIINKIQTNAPNAKGVLINIPDVSSIPYFTTVAYNAVPLDSATAGQLQTGFDAAYNPGLDAALASGAFPGLTQAEVDKRKISFTAGLTNAAIIDASEEVTNNELTDLSAAGIPAIRQATSSDLIVLPAASILGTPNSGPTDVWGLSATSPLPDNLVLTPTEVNELNTARLAFNAIIKAAADANNNFAFFDASAFMAELKASGIDYGTGNITSVYATGGGFSLDGVHPTARGYSVLANRIIDTINTAFSSNIPKVDPGTYTTIFLK